MEASGSSSSQTTIQESTASDNNADHSICCGQLANSMMNLSRLVFI
jgi:hypothetical protein